MKLGVYTIEKTLYEGEIKELIAKSSTGEISILQNHIPLITKLVAAPLRIIEIDGTEKSIDIGSGFLEVKPENSIVVLIDTL
jgi:F-type H+-transporting ATPase subunit epsilon